MANILPIPRQAARLNIEDGEVIVAPEDRDIFLISAARAAETCQDTISKADQVKRFQSELLIPLHDWLVAHERKVRACYLTAPGRQIQVFVVGVSPQFDFDLAEEAASLEMSLAKQGWRLGVLQLPSMDDENLAAFFKLEEALEVYAEQGSAPEEGGE